MLNITRRRLGLGLAVIVSSAAAAGAVAIAQDDPPDSSPTPGVQDGIVYDDGKGEEGEAVAIATLGDSEGFPADVDTPDEAIEWVLRDYPDSVTTLEDAYEYEQSHPEVTEAK